MTLSDVFRCKLHFKAAEQKTEICNDDEIKLNEKR